MLWLQVKAARCQEATALRVQVTSRWFCPRLVLHLRSCSCHLHRAAMLHPPRHLLLPQPQCIIPVYAMSYLLNRGFCTSCKSPKSKKILLQHSLLSLHTLEKSLLVLNYVEFHVLYIFFKGFHFAVSYWYYGFLFFVSGNMERHSRNASRQWKTQNFIMQRPSPYAQGKKTSAIFS